MTPSERVAAIRKRVATMSGPVILDSHMAFVNYQYDVPWLLSELASAQATIERLRGGGWHIYIYHRRYSDRHARRLRTAHRADGTII